MAKKKKSFKRRNFLYDEEQMRTNKEISKQINKRNSKKKIRKDEKKI